MRYSVPIDPFTLAAVQICENHEMQWCCTLSASVLAQCLLRSSAARAANCRGREIRSSTSAKMEMNEGHLPGNVERRFASHAADPTRYKVRVMNL